jgi:hypothetical protein
MVDTSGRLLDERINLTMVVLLSSTDIVAKLRSIYDSLARVAGVHLYESRQLHATVSPIHTYARWSEVDRSRMLNCLTPLRHTFEAYGGEVLGGLGHPALTNVSIRLEFDAPAGLVERRLQAEAELLQLGYAPTKADVGLVHVNIARFDMTCDVKAVTDVVSGSLPVPVVVRAPAAQLELSDMNQDRVEVLATVPFTTR